MLEQGAFLYEETFDYSPNNLLTSFLFFLSLTRCIFTHVGHVCVYESLGFVFLLMRYV